MERGERWRVQAIKRTSCTNDYTRKEERIAGPFYTNWRCLPWSPCLPVDDSMTHYDDGKSAVVSRPSTGIASSSYRRRHLHLIRSARASQRARWVLVWSSDDAGVASPSPRSVPALHLGSRLPLLGIHMDMWANQFDICLLRWFWFGYLWMRHNLQIN